MISPNVGDYEVQVRMPESMAMFKLRAFAQDLSGKIVQEAAPQGVVHVRLRVGGKSAPAWAIPGSWSGTGTGAHTGQSGLELDMDLRVHRPDPKQPNNLTIALRLRATKGSWAISHKELMEHYDKLHRDLKAYLQATTTSPGDFIPSPY